MFLDLMNFDINTFSDYFKISMLNGKKIQTQTGKQHPKTEARHKYKP